MMNDPYETITVHSSGRTKTTVKNARGQILYVTDRGVGDDGQTVQAKMGFAYSLTGSRIKRMDLNGVTMNLSAPTDPQPGYKDTSGNNISYWWYDGFGRLIANSDPDRGYTSQQYTDFGDVAQVTDALNRTVIMEYDRMGRMVTKYLPGTEGTVTYTYDTYAGTSNGLGRLVFMQDPAQNKTISYNKLGRTAWEKRSFRNLEATMSDFDKTYTTDFTHDLLGRKKQIDYPADPVRNTRMTVTYDYSGQGTTGVQLQFGLVYKNVIQAVEYDEFGQRGAITWGNGVTTQYEYDGRRRLTTLQSTTPFGGTPANLHEAAYTFNAQDSISAITVTSEVDPVGTGDTSIAYNYQYDGLNRLVEANANYERLGSSGSPVTKAFERTYRYAANGNLLGKTMNDPQSTDDPDEWSYSYVNHQARNVDSSLHGPDRLTMQYDDAGNMTHFKDTDMTKSMTYDSSNRITTVTKADGTVVGRYQYDDGGFRVRHISKRLEDSEYHEHDILYPSMYMGLEVQKEISGGVVENSFATVNNVYLNGVRIAAVVPNGDVTYYLTDQVDSVKVVVDDDGRPVTRTEYYPYGDTWFQEGDTKHAPKYNSQELDKESGLYFYNARYYDAGLSRFVTADTVIDGEFDTQGWNRYMYVRGNPIKYSDPSGHVGTSKLEGQFEDTDDDIANGAPASDNDAALEKRAEEERKNPNGLFIDDDLTDNSTKNSIKNKVKKRIMSKAKSSSSRTGSSKNKINVEKIIGAGKKWLGTSYKLGGNNKKGIDCTHFLWQAHNKAGYKYKFRPSATFHKIPEFKEIKRNKLKRGDVIIWQTKNPKGRYEGHGAIYMKKNKLLHSRGGRGVGYTSNYVKNYYKTNGYKNVKERYFRYKGKK